MEQSRRSVLVTVGVGATIGLAGCMGGDGTESDQNTGEESENTQNNSESESNNTENETSETVETEPTESNSNESDSQSDENTENTNSDVEFRQLHDNEIEWSFDSESQTGTATFVEGEVPPAGELHLEYGTINEPEKDIIDPPVNTGDTIEFSWSDKDEGGGIQMIWRYDGERSPFAYSTIPESE